jgi:hypothetical protein
LSAGGTSKGAATVAGEHTRQRARDRHHFGWDGRADLVEDALLPLAHGHHG